MILPCDCPHPYQDKEHGYKNRVHNPTTKGARCSVCLREKVGIRKEKE